MPNVKLRYAVSCDKVIVDDRKKVSLIGIFERVYLPAGSAGVAGKISFSIASCIGGEKGKYTQVITLISPSGKIVGTAQGVSEIIEDGSISTLVSDFKDAILPEVGKYELRVSLDNTIVSDPAVHFISLIPQPVA